MPLDPTNPYGSFYDYQSLRAAGRAQGSQNLGIGSSLSGELGTGYGGNMPTMNEFFTQQAEQVRNTQLMVDAMRGDPRGRTGADSILNMAFGGNAKDINAFYASIPGGRNAVNHSAGMLVNMPSISGFMGGDIRSIAFGAQAIAGGGVLMNGQRSFGSGVVQDQMSRGVYNRVMDSFFTSKGGNVASMTSGMNMDQLGGIMSLGGQQGAFAGLDMGRIANVSGHFQTTFNDASLGKIKDFVKTAAKTMSTLVDVFGNQDVGSLAGIMQRIAGLDMSSQQSVQLAGDRFRSIKATASVLGIGTGEAFRIAENGNAFGVGTLGMSTFGAGSLTNSLMSQAMTFARMSQADSRFNPHPIGAGDYMQLQQTDFNGMLRSPSGSRAALVELMGQTGKLEGSQLDSFRALAGHAVGPGGVAKFDQAFQGATGQSITALLHNFGGPSNIYNDILNTSSQGHVIGTIMGKQWPSQQQALIARQATQILGSNKLGMQAAGLISALNPQTLAAMMQSGGDLAGLAATDPGLGQGMTADAMNHYAQQVTNFKSAGGTLGDINEVMAMVNSNPLLKTFSSQSARAQQRSIARQAAVRQYDAASVTRYSSSTQAGLQGLLDSLDPENQDSLAYWALANRAITVNPDGSASRNAFSGLMLNPVKHGGALTPDEEQQFMKTMQSLPFDANQALYAASGKNDLGQKIWNPGMLTTWQDRPGQQRSAMVRQAYDMFMGMSPESRYNLLGRNYSQFTDNSTGLSTLLRKRDDSGRLIIPEDPADMRHSLAWKAIALDPSIDRGGNRSNQIFAMGQSTMYGRYGTYATSDGKLLNRSADNEAIGLRWLNDADQLSKLSPTTLSDIARLDPTMARTAQNTMEIAISKMRAMGMEVPGDYTHASKLLGSNGSGLPTTGMPSSVSISPDSIRALGQAIGQAVKSNQQ